MICKFSVSAYECFAIFINTSCKSLFYIQINVKKAKNIYLFVTIFYKRSSDYNGIEC